MSDTEKDLEVEEYQAQGSGASLTYPMQCSALRKNGHVVLNGRPCKIVDMSTSKTGKHGHAKVNLTGIDIFTGKKYEDICPSTHNMDVPNVSRAEYSLIDISDGYLTLFKEDTGVTKEDLPVPEGDIGEQITAAFAAGKDVLVSVISAMGIEGVTSFK
ncbi:eukaryotic translation initiation factor 5A [Heterostelium album PN500]|uniref:Eukaryotic translation initiation factor 5A n=1 Tax=Heterostelium pallidum (strain ATCC 26659 / Pp 5 / PN500) TaxID=670386 RepID=D3BPP6_HETP5|nr:eukaryotic translation initiation factor 5A [Heterostelium album PN500]EFA76608.1 eukaryotic translation initiation factor 5A [Heterostelium album PN500]|eukprot:XP_020428740.1 eukaryotic translation initiation factor 5A [Heterostelium album PN500]